MYFDKDECRDVQRLVETRCTHNFVATTAFCAITRPHARLVDEELLVGGTIASWCALMQCLFAFSLPDCGIEKSMGIKQYDE